MRETHKQGSPSPNAKVVEEIIQNLQQRIDELRETNSRYRKIIQSRLREHEEAKFELSSDIELELERKLDHQLGEVIEKEEEPYGPPNVISQNDSYQLPSEPKNDNDNGNDEDKKTKE